MLLLTSKIVPLYPNILVSEWTDFKYMYTSICKRLISKKWNFTWQKTKGKTNLTVGIKILLKFNEIVKQNQDEPGTVTVLILVHVKCHEQASLLTSFLVFG